MNRKLTRLIQLGQGISGNVMDGLENVLTGLGIQGKDKRLGAQYKQKKYARGLIEAMHDQSDVAKFAVNKVPELGTKKWITHSVDKEQGGMDAVNKITEYEDALKVKERFRKAWAWARLYGGAGIYISLDDGLDPREPINLNRIAKINSLTVLHRHELQRSDINEDIDSMNFGMPETYTISGRSVKDVPVVHHTRILRFDGLPLSEQQFKNNDYWNQSVLDQLYQLIIDYDSAYSGVAHALQDFDISILKLKNLADIVGGDDEGLLTGRLRLMQMSKSIMSSILIDADEESFEKLERQFSGVDAILGKLDQRLTMALDMPHTTTMGDGSTGNLSGAGESEQSTLNDLIAAQQDMVLTDNLNAFYEILFASKQGPTSGKPLNSWSYSYNPLNEPTEKQTAETRKLTAETDKMYWEMGVVNANEIAESRFGGDEYSMETNINMEDRSEQNATNKLTPEQTNNIMKGLDPDGNSVGGKGSPGNVENQPAPAPIDTTPKDPNSPEKPNPNTNTSSISE